MTIKIIFTVGLLLCCVRYWFLYKIDTNSKWLLQAHRIMTINNDGTIKTSHRVIFTMAVILLLIGIWTQ